MQLADRTARLFSELTPRARLGLLALGALLAIWGLLALSDAATQTAQRVDQLSAQLAAREAALSQQDWSVIADEAERVRRSAEARFWRAPTSGIAAARIQGALEQAARAAGVRNPRIEVREASAEDGFLLFEAQVVGEDRGGHFATYVEAAAGSDGELRLSLLEFSSQSRRFTARFIAPALLDDGEANDA